MDFAYKYPRPAVTVDMLIFKLTNPPQVLLIERKYNPFKNTWAFPGGFVDQNEALEKAAIRELMEETGLKNIALKQLHTFGDPGRDPRGHTVSVVFWGIARANEIVMAGDDASKAAWFDVKTHPRLAFDHHRILDFAISNITELRNLNY